MMCWIGSHLSLQAQSALDFWTSRDYQYVLRQAADSLLLIRSSDPALHPWLPDQQFGWQFSDMRSFHKAFEPSVLHPLALDFERYIILSLIRNDPFVWDIKVQAIEVDIAQATIDLTYSLNQLGEKLASPQLTNLLIGIVPTAQMQHLGYQNWTFRVKEIREDVSAEVPYLDPANTLMFPPFFTLDELREALPILRNSW